MIHHVFANKSNVGDWLSALGIQSLLAPFEFREHLCDEPFLDETLEKLSGLAPSDLIVIGGGGLFMDYFVPFWQGFQKIADRVPFCIWGVGYCDLKREASRPPQTLLEDIVRKSRLSSVRDEMSRRHLFRCALPSPVTCPSISIVKNSPRKGYGILHVDNYTTAGADVYDVMDACGRAFASNTQRPYLKTNNRISSGSKTSLKETIDLYAKSDIVLSSALHGCIIALAMGRRIVAVSGDHKVESFMEAAGLKDWVLDLNEIDSLPDRLSAVLRQQVPTDFIDRSRAENRAVAEQIKTLLGT
jgi:polysaccharide pyruvyl transferase WcaK-like protein